MAILIRGPTSLESQSRNEPPLFFYSWQTSFFDILLPRKAFPSLLSSEKKFCQPLCASAKTFHAFCSAGSAWAMAFFEKENKCNAINQSSLCSLPSAQYLESKQRQKEQADPSCPILCFSWWLFRPGRLGLPGSDKLSPFVLRPQLCCFASSLKFA